MRSATKQMETGLCTTIAPATANHAGSLTIAVDLEG
jgi:hypothetical protein